MEEWSLMLITLILYVRTMIVFDGVIRSLAVPLSDYRSLKMISSFLFELGCILEE